MILPDLSDLAELNTQNVFPRHEMRRSGCGCGYSRFFSDVDSSDSDSTASTAQCLSLRSDSVCCQVLHDGFDLDNHVILCEQNSTPNVPDCDAVFLPDFRDLSNFPVCDLTDFDTYITRRSSKSLEWSSVSAAKGWPGKAECGWHSALNLGVQILSAVLIVDCGHARDADTT